MCKPCKLACCGIVDTERSGAVAGAALLTLRCLHARHMPQQTSSSRGQLLSPGEGNDEEVGQRQGVGNRGSNSLCFLLSSFSSDVVVVVAIVTTFADWLNWMHGWKKKLEITINGIRHAPGCHLPRPVTLYLQIHLIYAFRLFPLACPRLGQVSAASLARQQKSLPSDLACLSCNPASTPSPNPSQWLLASCKFVFN